MTDPLHFTWTDAGAVAIIFYIVIKLLREVRAFIEIRNGTKKLEGLPVHCQKGLSEHCRKCHVLLAEIRSFQNSLDRYLPKALEKKSDQIVSNQKEMMACQKDILGKVEKILTNIDTLEDHNEGRYKGVQRTMKELMAEARKHKDSAVRGVEMLRLIKEHNVKSAKVIDAIMREKKL